MKPDLDIDDLAYDLGRATFHEAIERAQQVCSYERRRREKFNEAEIATLKARLAGLLECRQELRTVLRMAPSGDLNALRRRRWCYWIVAGLLVIASVVFAHLTLAPFGMGGEVWLYCLAIGMVAVFWTDQTLAKYGGCRLVASICAVGVLAGLGGLLVMALLRGDILGLYLKTALTASTLASPPEDSTTLAEAFYANAVVRLQVLMALLTLAMELGAGLALQEGRKLNLSAHQQAERARSAVPAVECEMVTIAGRLILLENDPDIFESRFMRDYLVGLLTGLRQHGLACLILVLVLALQPVGVSAEAVESLNLVIAIDQTKSVSATGYDGKTEYEKNLDGVSRVISALHAGTRLTVLAITDQSFARPYILLSRQLPPNRGPLQFYDQVAAVKRQVVADVRRLSRSLEPRFVQTDICGALLVAGEILRQSPQGRHVLILFSDMRHITPELDLERPARITLLQSLARAERYKLLADLNGIDVYALGVHDVGKPVTYWNSLRDFWLEYFRKAGANLKMYSALRDISESVGLQ